jgi:hypothetical protein
LSTQQLELLAGPGLLHLHQFRQALLLFQFPDYQALRPTTFELLQDSQVVSGRMAIRGPQSIEQQRHYEVAITLFTLRAAQDKHKLVSRAFDM